MGRSAVQGHPTSRRIVIPHIGIVTPAPRGSRRGNRITAERWQTLLAELGHRVDVVEHWDGGPVDVLVVLHAGRGRESVRRFRDRFPDRPLVVAVTGTDVYGDQFDKAEVAQSLEAADRIIVLQPRTADDLAPELGSRVRVIYQSAEPPARRDPRSPDVFEVAVVGHLRPVKDPFRAAQAARLLSPASALRIVHLGAALTDDMAEYARRESRDNPRYEWLGDLPHDVAMATMARCRLVALTSLSEGGPAAIAEAIVAGLPVVATRVSGCVGMLGDDYPGFFPPADTSALADLLDRAERDRTFYETLQSACDRRRPLFEPAAELAAWRNLLAELGVG
jgi:putative glycosyltransferase (TIGR04348 family)